MTVRAHLIALALPLFLAMALVDGALLYFGERSEMARALDEQARAAAVTTAAFLARPGAAEALAADPARRRRLALAGAAIPDLAGLSLTRPDGQVLELLPARPGAAASHLVVARAPAGAAGVVTARLDAGPMTGRLAFVGRAAGLAVAAAAAIAVALGAFVAGRIVRDLRACRAVLESAGGKDAGAAAPPAMRETRELADAARLMAASAAAAAGRRTRWRARRQEQGDAGAAILAGQRAGFAPVLRDFGGVSVAVRLSGAAPAGAFFAVASTAGGPVVAIGCCPAPDPADALARALATRRLLEGEIGRQGSAAALRLAAEAFGAGAFQLLGGAEAPSGLAVLAPQGAREQALALAASAGAVPPGALLDAVEALVAPDGVLAALAPARAA